MYKVSVIVNENVWELSSDGVNMSGTTQLGEGNEAYLQTIKKALEIATEEVEKQMSNVIQRSS